MSLLMQRTKFRYRPNIRGAVATASASGTSWVLTPTATVVPGNLLVACVLGTLDRVVTAPAGWTLAVQSSTGPTNEIFTKVATGAEPADYTFTMNASLTGIWVFFELLQAETVLAPIQSTGTSELSSVSTIGLSYTVPVPAIVITGLGITPTGFSSTIDNSFTAVALSGTTKLAYRLYTLPLGGQTTTWTIGGTTTQAAMTMVVIKGKLIQ